MNIYLNQQTNNENRPTFELFKSNVCHRIKELGDIDFLIESLKSKDIDMYYKKQWYPESFYLLAMVDYLSRLNNVPLCEDYNDIRKSKLKTVLYPSSIVSLSAVSNDAQIKQDAIKNAIPEFMRFNIVENDIRSVK